MNRKEQWITGVLSKHRKGYGFVIPEDKTKTEGRDVFISPDDMQTAMNKDVVSVRIRPAAGEGRGLEGRIEKILTRASTEIVGTFICKRGFGYVIPENSKTGEDILIFKKNFNGAKEGDKVTAKIIRWPSKDRKTEGKITEIISRKGEAGGDIKALVRAFNLKEEFPGKVLREAQSVPDSIPEKDIEGRKDLRNKTIITIDGSDAKDLDDAVCVERLQNGNYLLGVHIADVSHYVREDRPLDQEALKRGTSIYLIDQVIPMLPKELSNGICSLNPGTDRLTLSVEMEIDAFGQVISHDIFESVIRTKERMTYSDVSDMLENCNEELRQKYTEIYPDLVLMEELAAILRNKRRSRGSLDFDFDEAYITLDEEGIPVSVETAERRAANRMIEEFMLAANETIAEHFYYLDLPFIYRIHEKPASEKIEEFKRFLMGLGLRLKGSSEKVHPKELNDILEQVKDTTSENIVNTVMLRSMKKAFYGTECQGHFGLGVKFYCHFTSPIRRYPDLFIHRVIKETLHGSVYGSRVKTLKKKSVEAAEIASVTERKAEELEREVEKLKKAEYMSYRIGEEYEGIISGVVSSGFFVGIANTIEGLVRVDTIEDDYYIYEPESYRFIGRNYKKMFTIGDSVKVRVDTVDIPGREILFTLV